MRDENNGSNGGTGEAAGPEEKPGAGAAPSLLERPARTDNRRRTMRYGRYGKDTPPYKSIP